MYIRACLDKCPRQDGSDDFLSKVLFDSFGDSHNSSLDPLCENASSGPYFLAASTLIQGACHFMVSSR